MSLKNLTEEQIKEMAMVEVAYELFIESKKPYVFSELVKEIADLLDLSKQQVEDKIAQFYTDINIDGRFICVGENMWGLRTWYPYEQIEEEIVPTTTKPKKKKAKAADDDLDAGFDDIDDDFDDLDDFEEEDDDFDDLDDVDLDDDDEDDDDLVVEDDDYEDLDDDDEEDEEDDLEDEEN